MPVVGWIEDEKRKWDVIDYINYIHRYSLGILDFRIRQYVRVLHASHPLPSFSCRLLITISCCLRDSHDLCDDLHEKTCGTLSAVTICNIYLDLYTPRNAMIYKTSLAYHGSCAPSYQLRPSTFSHPGTRTLKNFPLSAFPERNTISKTALALASTVKSAPEPPISVCTHYEIC